MLHTASSANDNCSNDNNCGATTTTLTTGGTTTMSREDSDKQQQTRKCNQRLNTRNNETNMSLFSPSRRQCQTEWSWRTGWRTGWLDGWLSEWIWRALLDWQADWLAGRQTGCLAGRQKSIGQTLRHITVKTHENISQQRQANCRWRRGGGRKRDRREQRIKHAAGVRNKKVTNKHHMPAKMSTMQRCSRTHTQTHTRTLSHTHIHTHIQLIRAMTRGRCAGLPSKDLACRLSDSSSSSYNSRKCSRITFICCPCCLQLFVVVVVVFFACILCPFS